MKLSVPLSAPTTPPLTGASTMSTPKSAALLATSTLCSLSPVVQSIKSVSLLVASDSASSASKMPFSPQYTSSTSWREGSIVTIVLAMRATPAGALAGRTSRPE